MTETHQYSKDNPPDLPPGWIAIWDDEYET